MKDYKRVKDPIYGYIKIPVTYMTNIVDTAVFQRLRRVIQTSYSPHLFLRSSQPFCPLNGSILSGRING